VAKVAMVMPMEVMVMAMVMVMVLLRPLMVEEWMEEWQESQSQTDVDHEEPKFASCCLHHNHNSLHQKRNPCKS